MIPGRILVGAYPSSLDDVLNAEILKSILQLGITTFVCLQQGEDRALRVAVSSSVAATALARLLSTCHACSNHHLVMLISLCAEYEHHGVTEYMWRNGIKLRCVLCAGAVTSRCCAQYHRLCRLRRLLALFVYIFELRPHWLHTYRSLTSLVCRRHVGARCVSRLCVCRPYIYDAVQLLDSIEFPSSNKPDGLEFVHFPIVDCAVVSDTRVLRLCKDLVKRLLKGENMYIHCWYAERRLSSHSAAQVVCAPLFLYRLPIHGMCLGCGMCLDAAQGWSRSHRHRDRSHARPDLQPVPSGRDVVHTVLPRYACVPHGCAVATDR